MHWCILAFILDSLNHSQQSWPFSTVLYTNVHYFAGLFERSSKTKQASGSPGATASPGTRWQPCTRRLRRTWWDYWRMPTSSPCTAVVWPCSQRTFSWHAVSGVNRASRRTPRWPDLVCPVPLTASISGAARLIMMTRSTLLWTKCRMQTIKRVFHFRQIEDADLKMHDTCIVHCFVLYYIPSALCHHSSIITINHDSIQFSTQMCLFYTMSTSESENNTVKGEMVPVHVWAHLWVENVLFRVIMPQFSLERMSVSKADRSGSKW